MSATFFGYLKYGNPIYDPPLPFHPCDSPHRSQNIISTLLTNFMFPLELNLDSIRYRYLDPSITVSRVYSIAVKQIMVIAKSFSCQMLFSLRYQSTHLPGMKSNLASIMIFYHLWCTSFSAKLANRARGLDGPFFFQPVCRPELPLLINVGSNCHIIPNNLCRNQSGIMREVKEPHFTGIKRCLAITRTHAWLG